MEHTLLERCIEEERIYQFTAFSHSDALELGLDLLKASEEYGKTTAIEIRINHVCVFRFLPDKTGKFHEMWLKRKSNMVEVMEMSTLRAFALLEEKEEDMVSDWLLNPEDYAGCGGGFPIRIKNGCVIGSICVSGLPHLEDHAILMRGVEIFWGERPFAKGDIHGLAL